MSSMLRFNIVLADSWFISILTVRPISKVNYSTSLYSSMT